MILLCFTIFLIFLIDFSNYQNLTEVLLACNWLWDALKGPWDISEKNVKWIIWYVKLFEKPCQVMGIYSYTLVYREWLNIISIDIPNFIWNFSHLICPDAMLLVIILIIIKIFYVTEISKFLANCIILKSLNILKFCHL